MKLLATLFAILAAILYAINVPFSKMLMTKIAPTMQSGFLYLGAGIGISILSLFIRKKEESEKIHRNDLKYVIGMIVLDIIAPILMMYGLRDSNSSNASLLNNFEIVATALIALIIFKEKVNLKMWLAICLITLSSFILSFSDLGAFKISYGAILIILATLCWGLENNCTRMLANKNTFHIVMIKGICSGLGSLIIALCLKEAFPSMGIIALSLLLGFLSYGLSIFFYIKAQGIIGATKTSAYYSISPFVGSFLSFILLHEALEWSFFLGLVIMIFGTAIVLFDTIYPDGKVIFKRNKYKEQS